MANKQEQLEIAIVIAAKGALEELQNLQAGTERWEKVLAEVKTLVQTFSTTAKVSFSEAADAVGHAAEKTELLNKALAENAALVTAKAGGMKSMADDAETRATKARLDLAELELARKQGLANWQSQTTDMMFAPRDLELRPSQQTGRFAGQAGKYDTGAGKIMYNDLKQVGPLLEKLPEQTKNAAQGFNVLRSAMGFLLAAGMSALIQGLSQFFTNALALATEFRGKMAELNFAEAVLSKRGMDITRKELDDFVKEIEDKYKYLSKSESIGIVSTVADMGAEFNLTKEKILGLSDAVAFITLRERAYGMEVSDTGSIVNAALDGRSNYFNKLGINITKTAIKEKAYAMGLAEHGATISKEISNQAAIALLIEQTSGKFDDLLASIEQVNPALANQLRVSKELKDAQLEVGESVLTVKDSWNSFLSTLIESGSFDAIKDSLISTIFEVSNLIRAIENADAVITSFMDNMSALSGKSEDKKGGLIWRILTGGFAGDLLQSVANILATILAQVVAWIATMWIEVTSGVSFLKAWEDAGANAREAWKRGWAKTKKIFSGEENLFTGATPPKSTTEAPDTPTGVIEADQTANQNLLDAQAEFNQAILDAELKLGQDLEDAKIDYERKLYDIDVEYKAKGLDLENDYAKKVADINRSYSDKISEINQRQQEDKAKQRNDELQKEREFQNQMLVLKENFLMALDDALHARDARQILKLIKNYELDKAQAERKNALDKQSSKEDAELRQKSYNEDRKKAEADRKAKLAEAQRDYADKIAKLNADEAAEREAARLANERKIEDLHRSMQDRLEVIAAGLVEEYKLTEENLKGIVGLYLRYYNNATQILAAMRAQIAGTMQMMAQMQSYQYSAPIGPVFGGGNLPSSSNLGGSGGSGGSGNSGRPMANGGTIIANKPTTVTFGERGLEAGTFMPLGRVGKDVNSLFSNVSGAGDGSGKVSIELLLSPDLESRIVSNTLSKTAEVFTRTQRSKR